MTCTGSGEWVHPDERGVIVCPVCQLVTTTCASMSDEEQVPEHEAPAAARPCLRCQALEAALEQAVTKALEWRDAARLAAVIVVALKKGTP